MSRDLFTQVKIMTGNMCVFDFPPHLILLGNEFQSG